MAKKTAKKGGAAKRGGGGSPKGNGRGKTLAVSIGGYAPCKKGGHTIAISFPARSMTPNAARDLLVGSQLRVRLEGDPNATRDAGGQDKMEHAAVDLDALEFVGACGGLGLSPSRIRFSLSAPTVDAEHIAPFAFKEAVITLERLGDKVTAGSGRDVPDPDQQTFEVSNARNMAV